MRISTFIKTTRLFWALALSLALLGGALWALQPGAAAEAETLAAPQQALPVEAARTDPPPTLVETPPPPVVARATGPRVTTPPPSAHPADARDMLQPDYPADTRVAEPNRAMLFEAASIPAAQNIGPLRAPTLLAPPLPGNSDVVVGVDSGRVWGLTAPGATVTVTVDSVQMGAARADDVGFFWTTLYDGNGNRPALSGGETLAIYADGALVAESTLRAIAGAVDPLTGEVTGTIDGAALGTPVTAYIDSTEPTMTAYSQTTTTDGSGAFTVVFARPLTCDERVTLAYSENGIEIHAIVYSQRLCVLPFPHFRAVGSITPGAAVTVTAYEPDGVTIRSQEFATTDPATGRYDVSIDTTDDGIVMVEVAGGAVLSRTVDTLDIVIDTANDRIFGLAEPNATLRCLGSDLTPLGYKMARVTTVANAAGVYVCEMASVANLVPGRWAGVYIADAEGDDLVRWAPAQGSVEINQTLNEVSGIAVAPPGPLAEGRRVTVTLNGDAYVKPMEWYGNYYFGPNDGLPDIGPGDIVTVEAEGYAWQGVVQVITMTVEVDTPNDRFTGEVEWPTDRVELWARQWNGWSDQQLYPVGEIAEMLITASSPFTAALTGFDLRNAVDYSLDHRTPGEYLERVSGMVDFVRAWPEFNGVIALFSPPGTAYTLTLRDGGGGFKGQITGSSGGPIGHAGFSDFGWVGAQMADGDIIEAQSAAGFTQTIAVVGLTATLLEGSDTVTGYGPPNALLNIIIANEGYGFVPTGPNGAFTIKLEQLQIFEGDGVLDWGEWVRLCYADYEGNHVCRYSEWPQLTVRTFMDGRNDVFGDYAIPGNPIYITVTHPVSGVIATGSTYPGSGWSGTQSYALDFPDGILTPGVTVTVDWGDGLNAAVEIFELTGAPDPDADLVIGNAPPDSQVSVWARDQWGNERGLDGVPVAASGVYTADFNDIGWDIQYGDGFSVHAPAGDNHQIEYNFWLPMPELQIEKQQTPGYARPGGTYLYLIRYWNNGNGDAEHTLITDTLPADTAYFADTGGFPVIDGGAVITWELGTVPPYSYHEFYVALEIAPSIPPQTQLDENCVTITTSSPGDPDLGNNGSCAGGPWVDDSDAGVGVNKWPNPGDPHPGQEFSYDIDYWNNTGAASGPVWLTDTLPISTTFVRWEEQWGWDALWTEVSTTSGQLVLHAPGGIPGNMGGRIRLTLRLDENAPLGMQLPNHIVIATTPEDHPGDNAMTNSDARVSAARYDFQADKWTNGGIQTPGGFLNYGVRYENRGNIAAQVWLTDTLPLHTAYREGSADRCDQQGCIPFPPVLVTAEYVVWDLGVVGVNESRDFGFVLDIASDAPTGPITNCATVGGAFSESTPDDNTACVVDTVYPHGPNLRVTKRHEWHGDWRLNYHIELRNIGDETVQPVVVTDTYPLGTQFSGAWLEWGWPFGLDFTHNYTNSQLLWELEQLPPGWGWSVAFNMDLDEAGVPLRWYTNTVEVTLPPSDPTPEDNRYVDVAFSGSEVEWIDFDVYRNRVWGCAPRTPITVTTALTQMIFWDTCWNENNFPDTFDPGDVITVTAGAGLQPLIIHVPDPFTGYISSSTDEVWGQIGALDHETVQVDLWGFPAQWVQTDANGHYSATYPDVPRGAQGDVGYWTEIVYAQVGFHHRLVNYDLTLRVDYSHNGVDANYEPGHTGWVTVTDASAAIRATVEVTTAAWPWWNGSSGFSTHHHQWQPEHPDIQPGDWVYAAMDNGYDNAVQVGTINAAVNVDNDVVSGTLDVPWFTDGLQVRCEIHEDNGPDSIEVYDVNPNGGAFTCNFNGLWDITPGQNVVVNYIEPDGDQVQFRPANPTPHIRVEKRLSGGQPGVGGNVVFHVQYRNEGDGDAENVVITDTLHGMTYITDTSGLPFTGGGGRVIWELGTVAPGEWIGFSVFARVTAAESEWITNTVEIATSNPYDQAPPWEKYSEWHGQVVGNDTYLTIDKGAWTGDPAADYDVVFHVNVCNHGGTGSTQVTLTDTLHPSMTLQSWWYDLPGWVQIPSSDHELIVTKPALQGWNCEGIYLRARVDAAAWPGMELNNHAVITASNNLNPGGNETWWQGNVGEPHANLHINKWWNWGQLTPGGELHYNIHRQNNGNIPLGTFRITDTLPVSTTLIAAWRYDQYGQHPVVPIHNGDGYVIWEFSGLDNGYSEDFEIVLAVDPHATPGALLINTATGTCLPGEDTCDDNVASWTETLFDHGPNLRVVKWGDWHGDRPGHAWYHFRVENVGDEMVSQAVVTDTYPAPMTLEGGVNTDWGRVADYADDPAARWFAFTLNDVHPGYRLDFDFNTTITEPVDWGLILTNTVAVAPVTGDANPADDSSYYVLTTGADLWIEKELVSGELLPGELITFSLRFGNDQVGHAWWWRINGQAILTDTLPAGMEFITATQHWCGWTEWCERAPDLQDGETLVWQLWSLNPGEWNELYVTVRITDTATGLDTFTNHAEILSNEWWSDIEPYYDNNHAQIELLVPLPYFEVSKVYASSRVVSTMVTYTLTVTNTGNSAGHSVLLFDRHPAPLGRVATDGEWVGDDAVQWQFPTLATGDSATGWFSGVIGTCTPGTYTNENYAVIASAEGVTSTVGAPVSFTTIAPTLAVNFAASTTEVIVGTTVAFTDTSTTNGPGLTTWAWDFGDGSTSDVQHPSHLYTQDGEYTITLTVTDACAYTGVATTTVMVNPPNLVADFDQSAASVIVGNTVVFTDTSTTDGPTIATWAWDFGDGGTSSAQHPSYLFDTVGEFTVTLIITDALGYSDTATSTVTVTPDCIPLTGVNFTFAPLHPFVNTEITFNALITPLGATAPITYDWSFGDGQGAVIVVPTTPHLYTTAGQKTVRLTVINPCTQFSAVFAEHTITIEQRKVYLPLVLRNYP